MRLVVEDRKKQDKEKEANKRAIEDLKAEIIAGIPELSQLNSMYKGVKAHATKFAGMFTDKDGAMLAASTISLNAAGVAVSAMLELWSQWKDFNEQSIEREETMRRLGVGDMTNYTGMRRNIISSKITSKRRY